MGMMQHFTLLFVSCFAFLFCRFRSVLKHRDDQGRLAEGGSHLTLKARVSNLAGVWFQMESSVIRVWKRLLGAADIGWIDLVNQWCSLLANVIYDLLALLENVPHDSTISLIGYLC